MSHPSKQVLCVDDSPEICKAVSSILHMVEVSAAFDMAGALALAGETLFDLFIVDFYLPDGSGPDLLARLRMISPETPAVLMTTAGHLSDEEARRLGAARLVVKTGGTFVNDLTEIAERLVGRETSAKRA